MLKILRKKNTAKWIWIVLAILILPAFVFWGFGSYVRGKHEFAYAGKIAGRLVPLTDYRDAYEAIKDQAIMQFGENLTEVQKYLNFDAQAWERLVLLAEARRQRIRTKDKEVVELIESYPFFQRKGRFDEQIYNQILQYVFRTQPRLFEEQTRQSLILVKLYRIKTANIKVTEEEVKEEYRKNNEQLSIYYISSRPADFAKGLNPSEEEIKDFFTKNSFKFKQPLSFNIEYLSLSAEEKDENPLKNKLKEVSWRLRIKQELPKIAKDLGLELKETGLFGENDSIPGIGWSPQVLSLLAQSKVGQFLPPIKLDKKYYVVKLKERKEPFVQEFETIKNKVREVFIKERSQEIAKNKIADCLKKLREPADFEGTAKSLGLNAGSTDLFKYGGYIEGIGATDGFWTTAQGLKPDAVSEITEMPSGYYIIKIKSKIPMDEKKFKEEKESFTEKILLQKKQEYFARFTEDLKQKAQKFY